MNKLKTEQILALSMLPGVGRATVNQIVQIKDFEKQSIEELCKVSTRLKNSIDKNGLASWQEAQRKRDEQFKLASDNETKILSIFDHDYPQLLINSNDAPPLIFVKGELPKNNLSIAVIGTRKPSQDGIEITQKATENYLSKGAAIISGLAVGCDAVAHKTALENNGYTLAVLAHGLHMIDPATNRNLAYEILDSGGAWLSEYPLGTSPSRRFFVARDRIQAGLSHGVVLAQSTLKGGSLNASRASLEYGRWLEVARRTDDSEAFDANDILLNGTDEERNELFGKKVKDYSQLREFVVN